MMDTGQLFAGNELQFLQMASGIRNEPVNSF